MDTEHDRALVATEQGCSGLLRRPARTLALPLAALVCLAPAAMHQTDDALGGAVDELLDVLVCGLIAEGESA